MKSVGIKQLKARLSEYVRLARGGEITRAARGASRQPWSAQPLGLPKESVDRLLDELRDER
jgi:hypothetical protein